jgi:eukaryotic-like serine/threonine-protein kinase
MSTSSNRRDPVEALAEEFVARRRRGESVTVEEYAHRYPELADDIVLDPAFPADPFAPKQ